ncbi:MAG: DUF2007 domain-containing protein [Thermodesulfobacteriota bacterium]
MNLDHLVELRTYSSDVTASIAAARLGSEGIEAHIQKDDCGGAYPSLQMVGGVRIFVRPEDRERANEILEKIEAEDSKVIEQEEEPPEAPARTKKNPFVVIGAFLLGLVIGYFLEPSLIYRSSYTGVEKFDRNEAGIPGVTYHFVKGQVERSEEDRNYDGKPDAWHKFAAGSPSTSTWDDNFDSWPDKWATYKNPFKYVMRVDTDFDGKPDATVYFVNDLVQKRDWHPDDSAIIERRELYEHGVKKEELVDTDGDGVFDLKITYDRFERPISKTMVRIRY